MKKTPSSTAPSTIESVKPAGTPAGEERKTECISCRSLAAECADLKRQVEGLKRERDESAGLRGDLRLTEKERDDLKAKLAEAEMFASNAGMLFDECDRDRVHAEKERDEARAEAAAAEKALKELRLQDIDNALKLHEVVCEAAALREAIQYCLTNSGFDNWMTATLKRALSQPGPGAALLERVRKLEAVAEAIREFDEANHECSCGYADSTCKYCGGWDRIRHRLAALEDDRSPRKPVSG